MLGVPPWAWLHGAGAAEEAWDEGALALARTFNCAAVAGARRAGVPGIPQLLVVVSSMEAVEGGCATAVVADPTGSLHACLAARVLEEGGPDLAPGAVLLLRDVSAFTLRGRQHLNVTPDTVVCITPPAAAPTVRPYNRWVFA